MRAAGSPITLQALAHRGRAWAAEPAAASRPAQAGLRGAVAKTHATTAPVCQRRPGAWKATVAERRPTNRPAKRGCEAEARRHGRRPRPRPSPADSHVARRPHGRPDPRLTAPLPMARFKPRCAVLAWPVRTARRQIHPARQRTRS